MHTSLFLEIRNKIKKRWKNCLLIQEFQKFQEKKIYFFWDDHECLRYKLLEILKLKKMKKKKHTKKSQPAPQKIFKMESFTTTISNLKALTIAAKLHLDICGGLGYAYEFKVLTLWAPIPQNGQTHSNNSSAICRRIVWVCLTILWDWRLRVKKWRWDLEKDLIFNSNFLLVYYTFLVFRTYLNS